MHDLEAAAATVTSIPLILWCTFHHFFLIFRSDDFLSCIKRFGTLCLFCVYVLQHTIGSYDPCKLSEESLINICISRSKSITYENQLLDLAITRFRACAGLFSQKFETWTEKNLQLATAKDRSICATPAINRTYCPLQMAVLTWPWCVASLRLGSSCTTILVQDYYFLLRPHYSCLTRLKWAMCCTNNVLQFHPSLTLIHRHLKAGLKDVIRCTQLLSNSLISKLSFSFQHNSTKESN